MRNPRFIYERRKQLLSIFNIFLIFFFVRIVEYYILMPSLNFSSHGVITAAVGVTILFFYQKLVFGNLSSLGLAFNPIKIFKWIWIGAVLSLCPFIIISLIEFFSYKIIGTKFLLRVYSFGYTIGVHGASIWITSIIFCAFIAIVKAILFETLFRGLFLSRLRKLYSFYVANCLQSIMYMVWFLIIPLRYFIWKNHSYDTKYIIKLCLFYIVFEFMCAFKWGLLTRASGAVWVSLIDHIIFDFLIESIHFVKSAGDENWYLRAFMVMLASFCMTIVYYFYRKKKRPSLFKDSKTQAANFTDEETKVQKPEIIDYKDAISSFNKDSDQT